MREVGVYVCTQASMAVCMYACVHACMYIYIYISPIRMRIHIGRSRTPFLVMQRLAKVHKSGVTVLWSYIALHRGLQHSVAAQRTQPKLQILSRCAPFSPGARS